MLGTIAEKYEVAVYRLLTPGCERYAQDVNDMENRFVLIMLLKISHVKKNMGQAVNDSMGWMEKASIIPTIIAFVFLILN